MGNAILRSTPRPDVWAAPTPLPEIPPAPPFDLEILPPPLHGWIRNLSDAEPYPAEYLAVGALVVSGALIGRRCAVAPLGLDSDHIEVPNIWGAIVGSPSAGKTPSLRAAKRVIDALERKAQADNLRAMGAHNSAMAVHARVLKAAEKAIDTRAARGGVNLAAEADSLPAPPPAPRQTRYQVNDATIEALSAILANNPEGILLFRDELPGLLATLNKDYMAGARQFYLEGWGGLSGSSVDRKGKSPVHIEANCLSLLGGIQPGPLQEMLRADHATGGDGLLARFLLVYPDPPPRMIRREGAHKDHDAEREAMAAMERLPTLNADATGGVPHPALGIPVLAFDAEAQAVYRAWVETYLHPTCAAEGVAVLLEAALSKHRKLVPALALIDHLLGHGRGAVPAASLYRAIAIGRWAEAHLRRILGEGQAGIESAKELLRRLQAGDLPAPFRATDIYPRGWRHLDKDRTAEALGLLQRHGWIRAEDQPPGEAGGRPTVCYHAHPEALRHG